jgi:PKD repeat protein
MTSGIPDSGVSQTWFDDVGLIQWDNLKIISNYTSIIDNPNDYNYVQFFSPTSPDNNINIEMENSIIGEVSPLEANPRVINRSIKVPNYAHFFDESKGPIGSWLWNFNDNSTSYERHPSHYFSQAGIYNVSLTITGIDGDSDHSEIIIIAVTEDSEYFQAGDLNNDNTVNILDLTYCSSYILGLTTLTPEQFLAADIDNSNNIDIYYIYYIYNIYNIYN